MFSLQELCEIFKKVFLKTSANLSPRNMQTKWERSLCPFTFIDLGHAFCFFVYSKWSYHAKAFSVILMRLMLAEWITWQNKWTYIFLGSVFPIYFFNTLHWEVTGLDPRNTFSLTKVAGLNFCHTTNLISANVALYLIASFYTSRKWSSAWVFIIIIIIIMTLQKIRYISINVKF